MDEGVAQRVASYLQNAAADEQEKQEGATHHHDPVYPHTVPAKQSQVDRRQSDFQCSQTKNITSGARPLLKLPTK